MRRLLRVLQPVTAERHHITQSLDVDVHPQRFLKRITNGDVLPAELDGVDDLAAAEINDAGQRQAKPDDVRLRAERLRGAPHPAP